MTDLFCPTHTETRLLYALKGGAGYCVQCCLYVQAAGVPMPKPAKATRKTKKTKAKGRKKARSKAR